MPGDTTGQKVNGLSYIRLTGTACFACNSEQDTCVFYTKQSRCVWCAIINVSIMLFYIFFSSWSCEKLEVTAHTEDCSDLISVISWIYFLDINQSCTYCGLYIKDDFWKVWRKSKKDKLQIRLFFIKFWLLHERTKGEKLWKLRKCQEKNVSDAVKRVPKTLFVTGALVMRVGL